MTGRKPVPTVAEAPIAEKPVAFRAGDGTTLRGAVYGRPAVAAPAVVMSCGFHGVAADLHPYAQDLADAGLVVLLFDQRGFGDSDGSPRSDVATDRQVSDWRDAVSFALSLPNVDDRGVAVWGSGLSGDVALAVAAADRRVRCVVSHDANVSGGRFADALLGTSHRQALEDLIADDRARRGADGRPATLPLFRNPGVRLAVFPWPGPDDRAVTVRSVEQMLAFDAVKAARSLVRTPLLMSVAQGNHAPLDSFTAAQAPKHLIVVPGDPLLPPVSSFKHTGDFTREWLKRRLKFPPTPRTERSLSHAP